MADAPKDYTLNGYDQFLRLDNLSSELSRSLLNDFSNGINNANSDALIGSGAVGFSQTTMNNLLTNQDMQSDNFVTGSSGWRIQGNGNVEFGSGYFRGDLTGATGTFSGTITGGSLNIPDTTTANSFHVESDGDTFWGTTPALFTSDNNNATSYILKDGSARFSSVKITGLQSGSSLDGQYLQSLSVQTGSIANLAITASKIDNATITAAQIANATITGTQIASATITGSNISNATITSTQIANATITSTQISGTAGITGGQIASATITASNITNATITGTQIASATITGSNIASTTITASNIANATITGTQIASATIAAGNIVSGTITATQIASATILAGNIANGTITTSQISATAGIVGGQIASATITGGNIASTTITAGNITNLTITASQIANLTITSGKVQTGLMSYSHDIAFSVSSSTVVAWASGTITTSDGTSYSISSGNTGTMAARSYIYLDAAVSTTVLQVTTTFSTAVGDTKMLVATAQNNTTEAVFQVFNGIGGTNLAGSNIVAGSITANEIAANTITASLIAANTITASQIAAGTITATQIAAGTITADKMNVTDLSAISANIGAITAGSLAGVTMSIGSSNSIFKADANGIYLGNATFASAPFRVNMAGDLVATSATIGATNGSVGAWTINSTSIYTGTEDHSGYTANAGDMTLYSNGSDASIHANKFYIDSAGVLNCTAAVVAGAVTTTAGSSVDGTYLVPYTVTSGKAALALVGWTQTCAFTVTDADTVAWGSGTLTLSDGTTYSISAGNTGNMAAKTYIYLDVGVSTTAYQTTTTAATAIGDDKILLAIAQNGTGEATFMLLNNNSYNIDAANIVAGSITANEIAASTITANKIAANTITANELTTGAFVTTTANITDAIITSAKISDLSVAKLTAGTISSKAILLGITAGTGDSYIAGGNNLDLTNWRGGDGSGGAIILGLDDSDSDKGKFFAGNYSTSQYIQFDGTDMTISANLNIDAAYTAATAITAGDVIEQGTSANNAQKQTIDDIISNDIYDVSTLTSWSSQFVICKLDTNLYVGAWYKGSSTYSVAVFSYKNGKFIRGPIENTATDGRTPFTIFGIIKLSTTKALLGYTYDSGGTTNYGVRVYSVQSDKSLSVSSVTNLGSISTGTSGGLLTRISDDKFMVAWSGFGGGNPKAVCCTVSGTTVTAGTTKDLGDTATTGSVTSLILLDTDKLMTTVIQSSATRAAVLTVTGTTTITQGTVEPLANSNGNNATLSKLSTTKALVVFRNSASNLLTSGILNVSGTTITEVAAQTQVDTGTPAYNITSIPYSSSLVGVFYKKDSPYDTSSWFKYLTVDGSDNITASNPLLFTGYSTINFVKCDENLSDDFDALFFTGDKYLTGFSFKATKKSIGIAPANISAAASGTIRNKGLITGLSGYTVGQNIRDRYDMSIRAIAKDTTILNVI